MLLAVRPEALCLGNGHAAIAANVEEIAFGGASTRLLLRASAVPHLRLDVRLASDFRAQMPETG